MNWRSWRNRKKGISGIFMTALVVLMIPLQSAGAELPFTDVPASQWYFNDVLQAYGSELIDGFGDQTFRPDENMTYAQAVKLAACMNQKYTTGSVTLTNGSSQWYDSYVSYAKSNGIITKDYPWNASATRAGYVEIFAKALPDDALETKNAIADGAVPDVAMSHSQAAAIYKLYRAGILTGMDKEGTFQPDSNIRRSEVSAILTRMMSEGRRKKVKLGTDQVVSQLFLWSEGIHLTYGGHTVLTLHLCVPEGETISNALLMDNQSDIFLSIHKNELKKSEKQRSVGSEYYDDYYCTWSFDDAGDSDTRTAFSIRAEMGDATSNEVRLYRDIPVTDEMVDRLCAIEDELAAFAGEFTEKKENQTPEKVMFAVRGWLEDRPDVSGITEGTGNTILFYTADGLCGGYGLIDDHAEGTSEISDPVEPQLQEDTASTGRITTDIGQAAQSFNEAETASADGFLQTDSREGVTTDPDKLLEVFDQNNYSKKTPINTNSMVLLPLSLKGTLIGFDGSSEFSAIEALDSATGGTHLSVRDQTNLRIRDGSLAKYGTVTLTTHGVYVKDDNDPFAMFMTYANHSRDTAKSFWDSYLSQFSVKDQLNEQNSLMKIDEEGYSVWEENPAETKLCICCMQDITTFAAPVYVIMTSTNYIMDIYQDVVFPNTLMYFNACYGGADNRFAIFLQSRGATLLGPDKPADIASSVLLGIFFKSFMLKKATPEMISGFWRNYNVREARRYTNSTVGHFHDPEFCYLGRGRITGTIRDQAGNGISGATVKAYRYLNKKLVLQETVESKEDGTYSIDLDNGTYLLQAYKNNIETFLQVSNFDPAAVSLLQEQDMTLDIACPVISACIGEYHGKVYKIGNSVAELEALPVRPAKYSYICSFAFYNGKIYYCCKDGGTSDYRMALYEANLDGTGQKELLAPEKTDLNLNLFAIEKGFLYYREEHWSGRTMTETYHKIDLKDGTGSVSDNTPETIRKALSSGAMYLTSQGRWFAEAKSETNRFINDRIVMEKADGTTQTVAKTKKSISLDGVVPAGSGGDSYIYYSTIENGENSVLYRVKLSTGETKKIDSHMAAGGGGIYFNW